MTTPCPLAARKLAIARSQLVINKGQGFWGSLALRLLLVERNDIPTLAVDGKHIFYNAKFIRDTLTDSLTRSAMAHEVMHIAMENFVRRGERDHNRWNQACDYVNNQMLHDAGFEIGKDWLLNPAYAGKSAEEVYSLLPPPPPGGETPRVGEPGGALDSMIGSGPDGSGSMSESEAVEWKIATVQAAQIAQQAGHLPSTMRRFIEDAVKPKVDWQEQLRRFATQTSRDDYSWAHPNRMYLAATGFYIPGLYDECMGPMAVFIDTSGSIDQKTLNLFGSNIKAIAAAVRPTELHVIYCDAAVNHVDVFRPSDEITFTLHGGGGTAFKPAFDYVEKNQIRPECGVYLTDLYGNHRFAPPAYPVMWACISDEIASFGETIHIKE